ncbi:MAG TPA: hypothetical protein VIJ20_12480 [Solirubrobacteraceae bacterium]
MLAVAAAVVALSIVPAMAAKPTPSNCWGDCAGDYTGGSFAVLGHDVKYFADSERCLGTFGSERGQVDYVLVKKGLPLTKNDTFSFQGTVDIGPPSKVPVHIKVFGDFPTPTEAHVTLKISYKHCGTVHLKVKRYPPMEG